MKDSTTKDASAGPSRGRPRKDNPLSNAEKQRRYRKRKAETGGGAVVLSNAELWLICHALEGRIWTADLKDREKLIARLRERVT